MKRVSRKGFTLIELLVVISIISLLISILLPALSKARVAAQMAGSLSNIKQLSIAVHMYAGDNKSSLPFYNFSNKDLGGSDPRHRSWAEQLVLKNYVNSEGVFWSAGRIYDPQNSLRWRHPGYGLNTAAGPDLPDAVTHGYTPVNLDKSEGPGHSEMIMLSEVWSGAWSTEGDGTAGIYFVTPSRTSQDDGPFGDGSPVNPKLYCYDNANVTSYIDGHGKANNAETLGYESEGGGQRAGYWNGFLSISDYYYVEPWFTQWQSQ